VFIGGAVIQWLRDGLGILRASSESERLARSVPDSGGLALVPAFTGLGAPHWDPYARGALLGITRGTTRAHVARAALESIALQSAEVVKVLSRGSGYRLRSLRVDGGATRNDFLLQYQADLLGVPVERARYPETTAQGAAFLAGIGVGLWKDDREVAALWRPGGRFRPRGTASWRAGEWRRWDVAVARTRGWAQAVT
jgi:glycerol kinase